MGKTMKKHDSSRQNKGTERLRKVYKINPPTHTYRPPSERPEDLMRRRALEEYAERERRRTEVCDPLED